MSVRRVTLIVALALYVLLWVLALNGVNSLIAPLAVPPVLAVMVWLGLQLNRYLGLTPHRPQFKDADEDDATT
jgi:hypothetical protein